MKRVIAKSTGTQEVEKSSKSQHRLSKILDAAIEVFSSKGYKDAAMDDIAAVSETSKGGVYFHFPNKQSIFLALLDKLASLLYERAQSALNNEPDLRKKGDAALQVMLHTFAGHRTLTRLFFVEALGAGREFNAKIAEIHATFAKLIKDYLEEAVAGGVIAPLDTEITSVAWFGAVNQVVTRWVLTGQPEQLEETYPALQALLRRGIGL